MDLTVTNLAINGFIIFCYSFGTYITAYLGIRGTFVGATHVDEGGE